MASWYKVQEAWQVKQIVVGVAGGEKAGCGHIVE